MRQHSPPRKGEEERHKAIEIKKEQLTKNEGGERKRAERMRRKTERPKDSKKGSKRKKGAKLHKKE